MSSHFRTAEERQAKILKAPNDLLAPIRALSKRHNVESGLSYLEYKPPSFAKERKKRWPLLVFLHGAGESGYDLEGLYGEGATGCPHVELRYGRADPLLAKEFVVVAPQTNQGWGDPTRVARFVASLAANRNPSSSLRVDPRRIYITGVSMGGLGTLKAATAFRFAAIAPVCASGRVSPDDLGAEVPVWAFHGQNDVVVPVRVTERMIEDLRNVREKASGATGEVKFTSYPESPAPLGWPRYVGHASWVQAFKGPELYAWMLSHQLKEDEEEKGKKKKKENISL